MLLTKSSTFQRIIAGIVVLFSFLFWKQIGNMFTYSNSHETNRGIRVAHAYYGSIKKIDPAKVATMAQAGILRTIYGRLVEYTSDGQIVPGIVERFEWVGDEIHFIFPSGHKTIDGWPITARDAEISLKRLLLKGTNTHGDLRMFLCRDTKLSNVNDYCSGIRTEGEVLVLKPITRTKGQFLLPLLASADYSIIPSRAINLDNSDLDIIDFRNTSGVYYLAHEDTSGGFLLRANSKHPNYSSRIPQEASFIPVRGEESVEKFRNGEIDLILPHDGASIKTILALHSMHSDLNIHRTLNIRLWKISFSRMGQKNLSKSERIVLGTRIREAYLNSLNEESLTPSIEFFPTFGEGSLSSHQTESLKRTFSDALESKPRLRRNVTIAVRPGQKKKYVEALKHIENLEVQEFVKPPWLLPDNEQPEVYIGFTDSAFYEDISLISYNIDHGTFGMSREEGMHWLNSYMEIPDRALRLSKLRELHFKILTEAYVIPIGSAPFVAVARAPWKLNFSKFSASSPLWLVRRD